MLVRFAVANFLSFKESTEFSMVASKITRHDGHVAKCGGRRILKGSCIFGPNASGKSNLLSAISFAQSIIDDGLEKVAIEKMHFRLEDGYKEKPGVFQFDIFSHGHFYSYGFALSYQTLSFEEEWLYRIDGNEDFCVFLRQKEENGRFAISSDIRFGKLEEEIRFKVYKEDFSREKMNGKLFLADVFDHSPESGEYQPFKDVMEWFGKLVVISPDSEFASIPLLLDDDNEKTRLENLLRYFDTGIVSVKKEEVDFDKANMGPATRELRRRIASELREGDSHLVRTPFSLMEITRENGEIHADEVFLNHGYDEDWFEFGDESDGTKRLFDLIPVFKAALSGSVIFIDELERSLHSNLVKDFIGYFHELTEGVNTQLVVTTHNSNILDLDFLRQDEIWFIERKEDHSSELYSLNKFNVRFDKKIENDYLFGRYGAVPNLKKSELETDYM